MNLRAGRRKYVFLALLAPFALGAGGVRKIELVLVKRKPEGGVRTVRVARGEAIALGVRSDEAMAIHVHGYEIELRVEAGNAATVSFAAKLVGRFPVTAHLHDAKASGRHAEPTLLYLEVHPE